MVFHHSAESKEKMRLSHLGKSTWNKGIHQWEKQNHPFLGKHHSDKSKEKMSQSALGRKASEKTKKKLSIMRIGHSTSLATRKKIGMARKGKHLGPLSISHKEKISRGIQKHIQHHPDFIKKCLKRNKKSSLEIKFESIIQKNNLPYKFVGNGDYIIGKKCPDFINTNGEKIAIDVYYKSHKEMCKQNIDAWKNERKQIFKSYGWQLIFFDEIQVNENNILKELGWEPLL